MRDAILFHLYGGDAMVSMFLVAALVTVADLVRRFDGRPRAESTGRIFLLLSVPLAALTGSPTSLWIAIPLLAAWIVYATHGFVHENSTHRRSTAFAFLVLALSAVSLEGIHIYAQPGGSAASPTEVVILGDSLTSGGFGESKTWPEHLADRGLTVVDLSAPSATTESALRYQVPEMGDASDSVIIELGGNDMLDGGSLSAFASNLDLIVEEIQRRLGPNCRILLVELPVLPGKWRWASAQRKVARDRGIRIIPKRVLASVLLEAGNTFDGLHLTDEGHARFAHAIEPWL